MVANILAGTLALLVGMDSGVPDMERRETLAALLGCWLGAVVLMVMVAGVAELLQAAQPCTACRGTGVRGAHRHGWADTCTCAAGDARRGARCMTTSPDGAHR